MSETGSHKNTQDPTQHAMEARLKELNARIDLLSAQAERMQADAKVHGTETLQRLRKQRDAVAEELKKYAGATGTALETVGEGLKKAVDDLAQAVDEATNQFGRDQT